MSNQSIVTQIQQRINELKRELTLLEGALGALGGAKGGAAGRTRAPAPAGTFNLVRSEVLACLSSKARSTRDLVNVLIKKKNAKLDARGERVMWARVHQHLLQLEASREAKRSADGWSRAGAA